MSSRRFYQIFLTDLIFSILFLQLLFSQQLIIENSESETGVLKIGKIYGDIHELSKIKTSDSKEEIIGVFIKPDDMIRDVSFLSLGSSSKAFLAEEIGFLLGVKLRTYGIDFCVTGFPLTLSTNREKFPLPSKDYVSSSPYITTQILQLYYLGLIRSGVFPVIDGSKGFEMSVINSMKSRGIYLPILILEEQYEKFKILDYDVPVILKVKDKILCKDDIDFVKYIKLNWTLKIEDLDLKIQELRLEILKSSIVLVKRGRFKKIKIIGSKKDIESLDKDDGIILINDPLLVNPKKVGGLVVVFSKDDIVIDEAKRVLKGLSSASGKITWMNY